MDTTKLRLFAAVGGALFGFAGIVALAVALVFALSPIMGAAWAAATIAGALLAVSCACLYGFLLPHRAASEEVEQIENVTAEALADLPFDTIQAMVEKHPLKVATVAALTGYTLVSNPGESSKHVQRLVMGLL